MPQSVMKDFRGPDFPLGLITVAVPGTPVAITSLIDPSGVNNPNNPIPTAGGVTPAGAVSFDITAQQIIFQGVKPGAAHGVQNNTGNVYIVRKPQGTGSGNRDDFGAMVFVLAAGQTIVLAAPAPLMNIFSPYRYLIDADNAGDGALITLVIG